MQTILFALFAILTLFQGRLDRIKFLKTILIKRYFGQKI
ncbi:hypothetical protein LEP1GSC074_1301 [Leptospira noguchii str. Hook]|nr:hypothetical protein LEP1GSC074_1301 [Leptospira noguchii str. Hook]